MVKISERHLKKLRAKLPPDGTSRILAKIEQSGRKRPSPRMVQQVLKGTRNDHFDIIATAVLVAREHQEREQQAISQVLHEIDSLD